MTRQEMAEGIIASAEAQGVTLHTEGDQLVIEYLSGKGPDAVVEELLRTCRADIVEVLKERMWNAA